MLASCWRQLVLGCLVASQALATNDNSGTGSGSRAGAEDKLEIRSSKPYEVSYIKIPSFDGVEIAGVLFEPLESVFPGPRPTILLANSWMMDENEYYIQAGILARRGYVALSYANRGFGKSGGLVTVAGPAEAKDTTVIVDYLLANTRADPDRLGIAGISYGAGIALLAVAAEPRLKVAVSINGWANLEQALYGDDTLRSVWLKLLITTGRIFGRLSPEISENAKRLAERREVESVRQWARQRSPITYIDTINSRRPAILMINSYLDALFPPAQMRLFFNQLQGPKRLILDRGVHTSSSLGGLAGLPNEAWDETHRWLDHWLKGDDNGAEKAAALSFQTDDGREQYTSFPQLTQGPGILLEPINQLFGRPPQGPQIRYLAGVDSLATAGVPLLSDVASSHLDAPVQEWMQSIRKAHAAVFLTGKAGRGSRFRGAPRLELSISAHENPVQLVAYLYDVNVFGLGTLITHGVFTEFEPQSRDRRLQMDLNICAHDLKRGHRLAVVIDSEDPMYAHPSGPYAVSLAHNEQQRTILRLPTVD